MVSGWRICEGICEGVYLSLSGIRCIMVFEIYVVI
jgi:hypothetical protein